MCLAKALEHEIDHLNGRLYIDHVESPDRLRKVEHPVTPGRGTTEPGR
jgi:peptide deformylase